jgi:hypothetical protein
MDMSDVVGFVVWLQMYQKASIKSSRNDKVRG